MLLHLGQAQEVGYIFPQELGTNLFSTCYLTIAFYSLSRRSSDANSLMCETIKDPCARCSEGLFPRK